MGGCTVRRITVIIEFQSVQRLKLHMSDSQKVNKLMVLAFNTWSGPSYHLEQILSEIAMNNRDVDFIKIDVEKMADAAEEYGIQTVPTFLLMKNGQEVDKLVGSDQGELKNKILKHRNA
ncbi:hypothetical protein ACH5RR_035765 [Cinchona calisaya]|uniref:Thioredoxin domain-containing protein n=1 Tax=Cinchona calisaya TaxID=153742 RepID=A0ABD2Y2R7_9GENT